MAEVKTQDVVLNVKEDGHTVRGYNPDAKPANIQLAQKHGKAKRVYVSKEKDKIEEEGRELCPCCGLPVEGEQIPLCAPVSDLYHLGSGYALYFTYIKFVMGLLFLIFCISGIFNLISDAVKRDCPENTENVEDFCNRNFISILTIANKRDQTGLLETQLILNLITVIAIMFFFHFLRYQFRKINNQADDQTTTPSDYTLRVDGIPIETTDQQIKEWVENFSEENMKVEVRKINRSYQILEYIQTYKKKQTLSLRLNKAKVQAEIEQIKQELEAVDAKINAMKSEKLQYTPTAFITLKQAQQAHFVRSKFNKSLMRKIIDFFTPFLNTKERIEGKRVTVHRAPEPTDILWQNLCYKALDKYKSRAITSIVTLLMISGSFGLIVLITWGQNKSIDKYGEDSGQAKVLSILGSFLISIINTVLMMTIRILAQLEKHTTYTSFYAAVAGKLSVAQFINTALINLLAQIVLADTSNGASRWDAIDFYGAAGLLENMYYVFITNAFLGPLLNFFNPTYFLKRLKQKKAIQNGDNNNMTQAEANQLFEGLALDISAKYANLIKTVLLTCLYAPFMPLTMIFTMVGLFVNYWVDKYVLLRRQALPNSMGHELTDTMTEFLEWSAFLFAIGNVIVTQTLFNSNGEESFSTLPQGLIWAPVGISLFHIFFPMDWLNETLFKIEDKVTETETYDQARIEFMTDYDIENPITKKKALKEYMRLLTKKKAKEHAKTVVERNKIEKNLANVPQNQANPNNQTLNVTVIDPNNVSTDQLLNGSPNQNQNQQNTVNQTDLQGTPNEAKVLIQNQQGEQVDYDDDNDAQEDDGDDDPFDFLDQYASVAQDKVDVTKGNAATKDDTKAKVEELKKVSVENPEDLKKLGEVLLGKQLEKIPEVKPEIDPIEEYNRRFTQNSMIEEEDNPFADRDLDAPPLSVSAKKVRTNIVANLQSEFEKALHDDKTVQMASEINKNVSDFTKKFDLQKNEALGKSFGTLLFGDLISNNSSPEKPFIPEQSKNLTVTESNQSNPNNPFFQALNSQINLNSGIEKVEGEKSHPRGEIIDPFQVNNNSANNNGEMTQIPLFGSMRQTEQTFQNNLAQNQEQAENANNNAEVTQIPFFSSMKQTEQTFQNNPVQNQEQIIQTNFAQNQEQNIQNNPIQNQEQTFHVQNQELTQNPNIQSNINQEQNFNNGANTVSEKVITGDIQNPINNNNGNAFTSGEVNFNANANIIVKEGSFQPSSNVEHGEKVMHSESTFNPYQDNATQNPSNQV